MSKQCIACGMPMERTEQFAQGDPSKDYCIYCAKPDGSMQNFEEKLDSMTGFVIKTQGLDASVARELAREQLLKLPAWSNRT